MRKPIRLALLLAACTTALATAGSALASYNPRIVVTSPATAAGGPLVDINVKVDPADDPTAKVTIYIPQGYQVSSPAVGSKLGTVTAHAQAADLGGAVLPLTGDVLVIDPNSGSVPQQQAACIAPESPLAVWDLHLTAAGQTLDVPMFVVQTSGAETALAQYKIVVCLPPPDVPPGTPGRATFGAKLLDADFTDSAITNPQAAGEYRWRTIWTPYTPATGKPNPQGTKEAQAIVRIPTQLTISVKKSKVVKGKGKARRTWTLITITGKVSEAQTGIASQPVTVEYSSKPRGKLARLKAVTTNQAGVYRKTLLVKQTTYLLTETTIALRDLGSSGCTPTNPAVPCNDVSIGGAHLLSQKLKVTAFKFR